MRKINSTPPDLIRFAEKLCDEARKITSTYFRQDFLVDSKQDKTPVTVADRDTEKRLRSMISRQFPAHGIFGEEFGATDVARRNVWVIDPIDGTGSFVIGMPTYGTLVALLDEGSPVLGVIDMPILRERWIGATGIRTTLNGRPITTSSTSTLATTRMITTSPDAFSEAEEGMFKSLKRGVMITRYGGDCYAYGLLAAGCCDLVVETGLQPYDYLPLVPVIAGAGGVVTDWAGNQLGLQSDGRVLACSTPTLHAEALAYIERALS